MKPIDYFERAISSTNGICITTGFIHIAKEVRRSLYRERMKMRKQGTHSFDELSFLVRKKGDLWIVKRNEQKNSHYPYQTRNLSFEEING